MKKAMKLAIMSGAEEVALPPEETGMLSLWRKKAPDGWFVAMYFCDEPTLVLIHLPDIHHTWDPILKVEE